MRAWLGLVLLTVVGCGGKKDDTGEPVGDGPDPLTFNVDVPGPYNAGFRSWNTSYEVLGESRNIVVNVWYPTDDNGGEEVVYADLRPDPDAFGNADFAAPLYDGTYPLLVYSHGHQGLGGTSAEMMRWFASHGWVAVAPDHVGNLLNDNPDDEEPWFDALRPMDVKASVDALDALPGDDPLSVTRTDRYVLTGHSRGCTTVWSLLGTTYDPADTSDYCNGCDASALALFTDGSVVDERAIAAIPMAGSFNFGTYADDGFRVVDEPVLAMSGSNDNPGNSQAAWDAISGIDYRWLELEGGCHQTFALGVCETLDVEDGFWMVDTYALAFARHHLLGDQGAQTLGLLDGSIELDPRATLQIK